MASTPFGWPIPTSHSGRPAAHYPHPAMLVAVRPGAHDAGNPTSRFLPYTSTAACRPADVGSVRRASGWPNCATAWATVPKLKLCKSMTMKLASWRVGSYHAVCDSHLYASIWSWLVTGTTCTAPPELSVIVFAVQ